MLPTMVAKKVFIPMPGAMANGLLAIRAMQNVPRAEHRQVEMNMAFHRGVPVWKPVRMFGLRATMYPMVRNVDRPASSSVLTFVLLAVRPNLLSRLKN